MPSTFLIALRSRIPILDSIFGISVLPEDNPFLNPEITFLPTFFIPFGSLVSRYATNFSKRFNTSSNDNPFKDSLKLSSSAVNA